MKREYIEFIFVKPRSTSKLSKPCAWDTVLPTEVAVSMVLSMGVAASNPIVSAVQMACVPLVAPFTTPQVPVESWAHKPRARAYQRALFLACTIQGGMALFKFFSGDLIGGFFDTLLAACGMYAATPDGVTLLPTFTVFAAFNGFMDLLQMIQALHGTPLIFVVLHKAFLRPALLFTACYFAYQFHKELVAAIMGYPAASEESFFVKIFGSDAWGPPIGATLRPGTNVLADGDPEPAPRLNFAMFTGEGRRLGGETEKPE